MMRALLLLTLFASLLATGAATAKPFRHHFNEWRAYNKHWLSVCPIDHANKASLYGSHCWATTYAGEQSEYARRHQLSVYRHRDTGATQISFAIHWEDLDPQSSIVLKFDSAPAVDIAVSALEQRQTQNIYWLTDPVIVQSMLTDMRASNGLRVSYRFADGRREQTRFSMMGFTRAFKFTQTYAPIDR